MRREGWGLLNGGNVAVAVVLSFFTTFRLFGICGGKEMLKDKKLELLVFVDTKLG